MIIIHSPLEFPKLPGKVGFVPTMGALHEGHLSLIRKSKKECGLTVVSLFVNPTQFNNTEDFTNYPNLTDQDLELLKKENVDVVFMPTPESMYTDGYEIQINETADSRVLCGAHRPGHFSGVLTIVMKLLNITKPSKCYMGEKDFQQLHLIKKMAKSLFMTTEIVACPTVREADGLAMSSRNLRLTPEAREKAPLIYKLLNSNRSVSHIQFELTEAGFQVDYVDERWGRRFVAATIDDVRLIDNVSL